MTVRTSAPATSMVKVPSPVRTMPTWRMAPVSWAAAGTLTRAASPDPAIRMRPVRSLPVRMLVIPLLGQWNDHRLGLTVHREIDDHTVSFERLDHAVHHLVTAPQHHALAARVLGHRELVIRAPHDADD